MRKNLKAFLILLISIILTGCNKNYEVVSYSKFLGEFNSKKSYSIIDKTKTDEGVFKRSYESGNGKITFTYFEFDSAKEAKKYMGETYKKNKDYSYKKNGNYIEVKSKLFDPYTRVIQVDNVVITGKTNKKFDSHSVNKIYKNLGL